MRTGQTGGRPPGQPKTGGRKPGSLNKATASIMEAAAEYSVPALQTLAKVMLSDNSPPAARVGAAVAILDRAHGKPPQAISHTGKDGSDAIRVEFDLGKSARAIFNLMQAAKTNSGE